MGTISREFPIPKETCMKMSPLHCDISYDENKDLFIVTDLCSEQGTYSNRPIKQIKDYFVVGKKAITLHAKPSDAALAKELGDRFPIYVKVYVSPGTILTLGGVQILLWSSENPDEDELAEQFGIPEEL